MRDFCQAKELCRHVVAELRWSENSHLRHISAIVKNFPFIVKRLIFMSAAFEWFYASPFRFAFPDGKLWVFTLIKCREADKEKCDKSTKNDFSCNLQFAIIHRARVCVCAGAIASILWSFSWSFFSCCKALLNAVAPSRQCWLKKSLQSDYECTLSPCQFNGRNIKNRTFYHQPRLGRLVNNIEMIRLSFQIQFTFAKSYKKYFFFFRLERDKRKNY